MNRKQGGIYLFYKIARFLTSVTSEPKTRQELATESGFSLPRVHQLVGIGDGIDCIFEMPYVRSDFARGPKPTRYYMPNELFLLRKFARFVWQGRRLYEEGAYEDLAPTGPLGAWAGAFMELFQSAPPGGIVPAQEAADALCKWADDWERVGVLKMLLRNVPRSIMRWELESGGHEEGRLASLSLAPGMEEELQFCLWPATVLKQILPSGV